MPRLGGIRTQRKVCVQHRGNVKPTKRKLDKSNVYAVTVKYIYDALTELGVWVDDNDEYIKDEKLLETIHDKDNPRIVIKVTERGE